MNETPGTDVEEVREGAAPTRKVTFLFTDIEGSTRLWEQQPEAMRHALAEHDALLRAAIEGSHGSVFKTVGDAFFAVFADVRNAVEAAVGAQRALQKQLPQVRVRMALHTGTAEVREGDHFGPALNRVARLLAAGHGGQVLLSQTTAELIRPSLPSGTHLRPLGRHRLRDIAAPETISQLVISGLPAESPPLNTLDVAFRRGLVRATAAFTVLLVVISGLALLAANQARRATRLARREAHQRHVVEEGQKSLRRYLYAAQMRVVQQAWEAGDLDGARELLKRQRPGAGEEDLRGWEWRYLWNLCRDEARFTLRGHTKAILGIAFSPDGKTLATSSLDNTVRLWDRASHRAIATFRVPLDGGWTGGERLAFSPDGRLLAAGSADHTVRLWDVPSRRERIVLKGHKGAVWGVAFAPGGRLLASGSADGTLKLWDIAARRKVATLQGPGVLFNAVAFSPDGRLLATGDAGKNVRLWSVASRRQIAALPGHSSLVNSVAFSPDGQTLATASDDATVGLWDLRTRRVVAMLRGHRSYVHSVVFSPSGRYLASAGFDRTIKVWDVSTKQEVTTLRGHTALITCVAFSPDGESLASGSWDTTIRLWPAAGRGTAARLQQTGPVESVAFSPDGRLLATGTFDHRVKLWDVARQREVAFVRGHRGPVNCVVFSPDGKLLATASGDQTVKLWDVAGYPAADRRGMKAVLWVREVATLPLPPAWHHCIAFSPDGRLLATGGDPNTVRLWDLATRRITATLKGQPASTAPVAFSPDGRLLATGGADHSVQLWDVATRRQAAVLHGHTDSLVSVAFSPDGRLLASGSGDTTNKLWDLATRREIATLQGRAGPIESVAFSPDGKTLVTTSTDNAVELWQVATKQQVAALIGHGAAVQGATFSPDGSTLATGSVDATVRLWRAPAATP